MLVLLFDAGLSVLWTCKHEYYQATQNQGAPKDCSVLSGPIGLVVLAFSALWRKVFHDADAYVALFTAILVLSTTALWWSTRQLWQATVDADKARASDTKILERAYINVEPGGIVPITTGKACIPNIEIHNAGRLPARNVRWAIEFALDKNDRRPKDQLVITREFEGENTLTPGGRMIQGGPLLIYVGREPHELKRELGLYVYAWGAVKYEDGFGQDRQTNFCHRYNCINLENADPVVQQGVGFKTISYDRGVRIARDMARVHRYGNDAT